jgi:DNA-binding protein HU-beta
MNKTEFTAALATATGLTSTKAAEVVAAIFDTEAGIIANTLATGGEVKITGFGNFTAKARAERAASNPQTKEKMIVPGSTAAKFAAGKNLKERLNKA